MDPEKQIELWKVNVCGGGAGNNDINRRQGHIRGVQLEFWLVSDSSVELQLTGMG